MASLKDLIYFDLEKVKSISSQLSDGLINEITRAIEEESNSDEGAGINLQFLKIDGSVKSTEKNIHTQKIEVYHEALNNLEKELLEKKLLVNLNSQYENGEKSFVDFREEISNYSFIKVTGWVKFEDFEKLKLITSNINDIQRFIFHNDIENNPELNIIRKQINDKRRELNRNKNAIHKDYLALSNLEKKLDELALQHYNIKLFDESWIERMKIFLDTFSPNRLNVRVMPFEIFSDFQILASLKEKYLTNGDYNNLLYNYGSRPNLKLTILGIITSCPQIIDERVHPDDEYNFINETELDPTQNFEKVFRNLFSTFETLDKFFFMPSYPKVGVHPLALYREINY